MVHIWLYATALCVCFAASHFISTALTLLFARASVHHIRHCYCKKSSNSHKWINVCNNDKSTHTYSMRVAGRATHTHTHSHTHAIPNGMMMYVLYACMKDAGGAIATEWMEEKKHAQHTSSNIKHEKFKSFLFTAAVKAQNENVIKKFHSW